MPMVMVVVVVMERTVNRLLWRRAVVMEAGEKLQIEKEEAEEAG